MNTYADDMEIARSLIADCQDDLNCALSDGQKRDLLCDNTDWTQEYVAGIVESLNSADAEMG